jgi:peptidoglycan/LPS O-acetylase OafA/YrhL
MDVKGPMSLGVTDKLIGGTSLVPEADASISVPPSVSPGSPANAVRSGHRVAWSSWLNETFLLNDDGRDRLLAMEGLRGVAIILVFFVHFGGMIEPWTPAGTLTAAIRSVLAKTGHTGVDLFFVLSGFLIYSALIRKPRRYGRFVNRRVQRIYPAFLAIFALYVALSFIFPGQRKFPSDVASAGKYFAANLFLLPGLLPMDPMITVSWSLSYEMGFYLALPAIIWLLQLRRRSRAVRILAAISLSFIAIAALPRVFRIAMFGSGLLLADLAGRYASREPHPRTDYFAIAVFLIGLPVAGVLLQLPPMETEARALAVRLSYIGLASLAAISVCIAAFFRRGLLNRVLSVKPLRLLGNMSYTYYLAHGVTLKGIFLVFGLVVPLSSASSAWYWVAIVPAFALTVVVSGMLFILVERRFSIVTAPAASA